jgi:hypothetical protein
MCLAKFEFEFEEQLLVVQRRCMLECRKPSVTSTICLFHAWSQGIRHFRCDVTHVWERKFTLANKLVIFTNLLTYIACHQQFFRIVKGPPASILCVSRSGVGDKGLEPSLNRLGALRTLVSSREADKGNNDPRGPPPPSWSHTRSIKLSTAAATILHTNK